MDNSKPIPIEHNLHLLETIEQNPQVTQADLAAQLGVAVGTVNWYLKRLIAKGYVKIRRMQRKRLLYLITPTGISEKSRLGVAYMRYSLQFYRDTRIQAVQLLHQARNAGHRQVCINAEGDLGEICRLTCLEQGVEVVKPLRSNGIPKIKADGTRLKLELPE
jgi:hypothetical protein